MKCSHNSATDNAINITTVDATAKPNLNLDYAGFNILFPELIYFKCIISLRVNEEHYQVIVRELI